MSSFLKLKLFLFLYTLIFAFFLQVSTSFSNNNIKRVSIYKAFNGNLDTHLSGFSRTGPPFLKVIRSEEGLEHMLKEFKNIKNYTTQRRLPRLNNKLKKINLNNHMMLVILTNPVDNYKMDFKGLYKINNERLEIKLNYTHTIDSEYNITPIKKIYYKILVVKKNNLPVLLNSENNQIDQVTKKSPVKYISGKIYIGKNDEVRLVESKRRKGIIYYIKGGWAEKLKKYEGQTITLRGRILTKQEGLYEAVFKVDKFIKKK